MNKQGEVLRNKSSLVCKDCLQQEGIDFKLTFYLVARLESVRIILAYASNKKFQDISYQCEVIFFE